MANINESRKLLGAHAAMSLKELNVLYKGLMKQHHPDRFQDEQQRVEAEEMSQRIIAAYKLLESMHPETHAIRKRELEEAMASNVSDWLYEREVLTINFVDGSAYAFHGVGRNTYNKFVNTDGAVRFVRRHLVGKFTFRRTASPTGA